VAGGCREVGTRQAWGKKKAADRRCSSLPVTPTGSNHTKYDLTGGTARQDGSVMSSRAQLRQMPIANNIPDLLSADDHGLKGRWFMIRWSRDDVLLSEEGSGVPSQFKVPLISL
jgi:hypothetical protein